MAVVRYTAKRSLTGGVSVDDVVVKDLPLTVNTRRRLVERSDSVALGGGRESVYQRGEIARSLTTVPQQLGTPADEMRMFLDSVEGGEQFEFSPYQSSSESPINYVNVKITSKGYQESRAVRRGGTGGTDFVAFSFSMINV